MTKDMKKRTAVFICTCLYVVYGIACLYLFYRQAMQPLDENNRLFQSDLPYHISMIVDDGWYYSLTAYIYQVLYKLGGRTTGLIALFLAVVTTGTVVVTAMALAGGKTQTPMQQVSAAVKALMCNLVMAFYLKSAGQYRYVSYQNGNLWHNSTYLCMRLMAMLCMLYFMHNLWDYSEKLTWKKWIIFSVLLVITTMIKPSFLTVFAPALAVKLLWDLCHGVKFGKVFYFGCSVLPSCLVVLWQNAVLFGQDTGNGFSVNPWYTFSLHADRPKVAVLCSLAFPLVVLLFRCKDLFQNKKYFFTWMMTGVGFLEALLLAETGTRSRDGNFLWGYLFALFYLYVVSVQYLPVLFAEYKKKKGLKTFLPFAVSSVVFLYQLYGGVYFFLRLLSGETYFMLG